MKSCSSRRLTEYERLYQRAEELGHIESERRIWHGLLLAVLRVVRVVEQV
jgi:hypothetical protein